MNRFATGFAASVVALGAMNSAQAVLISADFVSGRTNDASGAVTADNNFLTTPAVGDTQLSGPVQNADGITFVGQNGAWNAVLLPTSTGPINARNGNIPFAGITSALLFDGSGGVTNVRFVLPPMQNPGVSPISGIARVRAADGTANQNASTGSGILRNEAFSTNPSFTANTIAWAITGLDPSTIYDMVVFGDSFALAQGVSNTANSIVGVLDTEGDWNWQGIMSSATGEITGLLAVPPGTNGLSAAVQARMYGFQIQSASAAVPEPATLSLGAIGLAALAFRRRRAVV